MNNISEILGLCRLCLAKEQVNVSIFEDIENRETSVKINACLPVKISENDNLPKNICNDCLYKLDDFYNFWNQSANSEKQLIQWLEDLGIHLSDISEPNHSESLVKQEKIDYIDIRNTTNNANNVQTDDAHGYIIQPQQQLPFQHFYEEAQASTSSVSEISPRKRPRRAAAMKKIIPPQELDIDDDDDDDDENDDMETVQVITKMEKIDDNSNKVHETNFGIENDQAGPSGISKTIPSNPECLTTMNHLNEVANSNSEDLNNSSRNEQNDIDDKIDLNNDVCYVCPLCKDDNISLPYNELKIHFENNHSDQQLNDVLLPTEPIVCKLCDATFMIKAMLRKHINKEHSLKLWECKKCESTHIELIDLIAHMTTHPPNKGLFKCMWCDFLSLTIEEIKIHLEISHDATSKYECMRCNKLFKTLKYYKEHENVHSGKNLFLCPYCGDRFPTSQSLSLHKRREHSEVFVEKKPHLYTCRGCKKQFQYKKSLKMHMENIHLGIRCMCDICGKTLSNKDHLKKHLHMHAGFKPHKCTYCGKAFVCKYNLRQHIRIHTDEKPYICEYCSKGFAQRTSLVIHIRSIHTLERPYSCHICKKGFAARAMLNIHLKKQCRGISAE